MSLLQTLRAYLGGDSARRRAERIDTIASLQNFLETRASHVTQTSLYGYLRTRAGSRYPQLFANDDFAKVMNAAKWNIWLACVSDLAVYAGSLLAQRGAHAAGDTTRVMSMVIDNIFESGTPPEADREYPALADRVRERVCACPWHDVPDNDAAFSESPDALVRWAPIVDELKELDAEIVRNSVRFRWQEVRQELRKSLDAGAVLKSGLDAALSGDVAAPGA